MGNSAPLIISLTSTQQRLPTVYLTVASLLQQTHRSDKVVLWLSHEPYLLDSGASDEDITEELQELLEDDRFSIRWTKNTGPYRKLLPSLQEFGRDATIVTADDDVIYPKWWLKKLVDASQEHPGCVICYRGRIMPTNGKLGRYTKWTRTHEAENQSDLGPNVYVFPTGKDGVLYPAGVFGDQIFDEEVYMKLAPTNDDIWFKAMTLVTKSQVLCIPAHKDFPEIASTRDNRLYTFKNKRRNDRMIRKVFDKYGLKANL
ncbi:MAG: glycosyltransferase family 2 protein [Cyclobacteriaceae bacterium]|nr:glycosyltransferase family 2 protein [Cyclobacteriaceae bacterium HetDA_MAG_MS6]